MLRQVVALCVCACVCVRGAPHKRTNYDQRQQGELNIHAQLENIVVVFIPTSQVSLMELGLKKYQEKPQGFLQMLQKFKDDMSTVSNEISPVVASSQEVLLNHEQNEEEKEEEVVATVEEMKPDSSEKIAAETSKEETTQGTPVSDHSTLSESVQESVLVISVPEHLKDAEKAAEDEVKSTLPGKESEKELEPSVAEAEPVKVVPVKEESNMDKIVKDVPKKELTLEDLLRPISGKDKLHSANPSDDKVKKSADQMSNLSEKEVVVEAVLHEAPKKPKEVADGSKDKILEEPKKKAEEPPKKSIVEEEPKKIVEEPAKSNAEEPPKKSITEEEPKKKFDEPLKSTAQEVPKKSSEDPKKAVDAVKPSTETGLLKKEDSAGPRREKVIRYKAESSKWAPGLVGVMGPVGQKAREEVQRFASLCHPGVWDLELQTCLMPGERRSRSELEKFLAAVRFGIAAPAQ